MLRQWLLPQQSHTSTICASSQGICWLLKNHGLDFALFQKLPSQTGKLKGLFCCCHYCCLLVSNKPFGFPVVVSTGFWKFTNDKSCSSSILEPHKLHLLFKCHSAQNKRVLSHHHALRSVISENPTLNCGLESE